jgi:type IX secretion system PorP/SprF family membrane protein
MKNIIIPILFVQISLVASAQQLSTYTLYRDNWNILNPAIVSNNYLIYDYNMTATASYRHQWAGLKDAPRNQAVHFEYVPDSYNVVFGGHLLNDKTGYLGMTGAYGNFAYRMDFQRTVEQSLIIGLTAGLVQYRARLSQIQLSENDDVAASVDDQQLFPDFGVGAFYRYSDLFYAGISVPQTLGLNTTFRGDNGEFAIHRTQHFYGIVGSYISLDVVGDGASYLEPTVWVKYVPHTPLSLDVNLRYQFSNVLWLGVGGNLAKTLHAEAGVMLGENVELFYNGQLKIGIGYDHGFNPYSQFFGSSFELNLSYSWVNK